MGKPFPLSSGVMSTAPLSAAEMTSGQSLREPMFIPTASTLPMKRLHTKPGLVISNSSVTESLQATNTSVELVQPLPSKNISQMARQGRSRGSGPPRTLEKRWWTRSHTAALMCPLTNFPIQLLPYPPFKLCSEPEPSKQSPGGPGAHGAHTLLDGKFLALQLIVHGRSGPGIRELLPSDLTALDLYIQRCKLGPFRPGAARNLAEEMHTAPTQAERERAATDLHKLRAKTRSEMGKLRRIQENRLAQLRTLKEEHVREIPKEVDIPTSRFFEPLQVKDMELKRLHL